MDREIKIGDIYFYDGLIIQIIDVINDIYTHIILINGQYINQVTTDYINKNYTYITNISLPKIYSLYKYLNNSDYVILYKEYQVSKLDLCNNVLTIKTNEGDDYTMHVLYDDEETIKEFDVFSKIYIE